MHAYYFSTMAGLLEKEGIGVAELLENTGLQLQRSQDALVINASHMNAVCSNALALSNDPQFGLRHGSHINITSQGIFGYALMTSATIGDALKLLVRYSKDILPSVYIKMEQIGGQVDVVVEAANLPLELERYYCEVLFSAIINSGSMLVGPRASQASLELDYEAPRDREQYYQVFGPQVRFNSGRCALSFEETSLGIAISTANPLAQDIFRRECDRLFARENRRGRVSEQVQQLLLKSGSDFPTSAQLAQKLNMSESTLQRRLAKEGSRYQQLLDQVRYRLASEYLVGTRLPVAEIANLLGFSDAANFRRSFRRWSGTTPSAIRIG